MPNVFGERTHNEIIATSQVTRAREEIQSLRSLLNRARIRAQDDGQNEVYRHLHNAVIATHALDRHLALALGEEWPEP